MAQAFSNGFSRVNPSIILSREEGKKNRSGATRLYPVLLWEKEQVKERMTQLGALGDAGRGCVSRIN